MTKSSIRKVLIAAFALCSLLMASTNAMASGDFRTSFALAQGTFENGEFEKTLLTLSELATLTTDHGELAKVHTMKALCFAGLNKRESAKASFLDALEHDPTIKLDVDEVSPETIEILEKLKTTIYASVSIKTNRTGAIIVMDGKNLGITPLRTDVLIGRHRFELKDPENNQVTIEEVDVRARQMHDIYIPFEAPDQDRDGNGQSSYDDLVEEAESADSFEGENDQILEMDTEVMRVASGERAGGRRAYFLIDLRYVMGGAFGSSPKELPDNLKADSELRLGGFELGLGVAGRDLMGLAAVSFSNGTWGVTPKFGFHVKFLPIFGLQGSLDLPMVFPDGNFYLGAGASIGLFIRPVSFFGVFLEGSYKYFFVSPKTEDLIKDESEFFGSNVWGASLGVRFFI